MQIRAFRPADAEALAVLFFDSVRVLGLRRYSQRQVEAWAPAAPDPTLFLRRAADGRIFLVAVNDEQRPIAYGDFEPDGHIDHLYCHPHYAGRGAASLLYDHLEQAGRERKLLRFHAEASETARGFFLRKGFVEIERREFQLRGVGLHNYRMAKELDLPERGR